MDEEIDKILRNHENRIKLLEDAVFVKKTKPLDKLTFGTFVKKIKTKTYEQKALAIGKHLWEYENRNFIYDDIINFSKKVAWKLYSNPTVLIRELKRKGFIEEVGKNKEGKIEYRILEDGLSSIEKGKQSKGVKT